jgi:hypothetical protein
VRWTIVSLGLPNLTGRDFAARFHFFGVLAQGVYDAVNSAITGETMLRNAGRLLNIKPGAVVELYGRRRDILTQVIDRIV